MKQVPGVVMPKLSYRAWKTEAENRVVSWRWCTDYVTHPLPFYFELWGFARGRVLKHAPRRPSEFDHCEGLDAQGKVVVARRYTGITQGGRPWFHEDFFRYGADCIEWAEFDYSEPEKELNEYHTLTLKNGLVVEHKCAAQVHSSRETYTYESGKLMRIDTVAAWQHDETPTPMVTMLRWGSADRPDVIVCQRGTEPETVVWRRPELMAGARTLLRRCEDFFVDAIPRQLKAKRLKGSIYSLVLAYDEEDRLLPPTVSVGLRDERDEWIRSKGAEAADYIWNPAEYRHSDVCDLTGATERAAEDIDMVNQLVNEAGLEGRTFAMLDRVAKRLAALDWSKIMSTTDDFVVYVVDLELSRLVQGLRRAATPKQFKAWVRAGIAPTA